MAPSLNVEKTEAVHGGSLAAGPVMMKLQASLAGSQMPNGLMGSKLGVGGQYTRFLAYSVAKTHGQFPAKAATRRRIRPSNNLSDQNGRQQPTTQAQRPSERLQRSSISSAASSDTFYYAAGNGRRSRNAGSDASPTSREESATRGTTRSMSRQNPRTYGQQLTLRRRINARTANRQLTDEALEVAPARPGVEGLAEIKAKRRKLNGCERRRSLEVALQRAEIVGKWFERTTASTPQASRTEHEVSPLSAVGAKQTLQGATASNNRRRRRSTIIRRKAAVCLYRRPSAQVSVPERIRPRIREHFCPSAPADVSERKQSRQILARLRRRKQKRPQRNQKRSLSRNREAKSKREPRPTPRLPLPRKTKSAAATARASASRNSANRRRPRHGGSENTKPDAEMLGSVPPVPQVQRLRCACNNEGCVLRWWCPRRTKKRRSSTPRRHNENWTS